MNAATGSRDFGWLLWLCASRTSFTLIFTAYAAAIPLLKPEWGMSAGEAGLIQSAWHFGYLFSLVAVGFLADRYGAKRVFIVSSVAASTSAMVFALFAESFLTGAILYGLTGLFSGGSYTPGLALIAERFQPARRGRAMGFYLAAASAGYALALVLTGALTPLIGWRGAFIVNAAGPLLGTLLALVALRDTPNVVHPRTTGEAAEKPVGVILGNRPAMLVTWAYTFHSWEMLGMKAWMPAFLSAAAAYSTGSSATAAASLGAGLAAVAYVGSMGGSVFGGWLSDRMGRTWTMMVLATISAACSLALGWLIDLPLWLLVAICAFYSFAAVGDSSVYSTAVTELVPPRHIGAAYSVRSVLGFGAGAIAPWVFGLVLDAAGAAEASPLVTWGLAWCSLGVIALMSPVATWRLRQMPEARQMANGRR
ncbi:MAG: MFS transporter [Betaproteobacteria bacterium]|nr:MFS transporter [Betaproteobacteria bacterium]